MDELMARLRAMARRAGDVRDIAKVYVGGHTVDLAQNTVMGPKGATGSARRSALVDRMTGGERGTDLVGERDGQQPLLQ